ncbi:hypothetical protein BB561_003761 [Smittium simulii]|uniref:ATP-grasp domain-containing protein n=1 Tax=Smittium simulii TaxID=133385 RepID=A0A2T9YJJ2_9FUNG|nr:hypothetical protein BB561_003761 [Smittium simulii]
MKVLIIGSGGREHALALAIAKSSKVSQIFVAPGNGGTESGNPKIQNVKINHNKEDFHKLTQFAVENDINLVIPGPEQPLVDGISASFKKIGVPCFGPSTVAASLEGSKAFSKDFMRKHNIPTAEYKNFTDYNKAKAYLESIDHKVVVKASGLAAGKGVYIPNNKQEALDSLKELMVDRVFGDSGAEVVIEEFLEGEEISVLAISDGYTVVQLPAAQDHKRAYNNDEGPNTGGMGAYAPAPVATKELLAEIQNSVIKPTIDGMRKDGFPFVGCLFTGFMLTPNGPKVLEYNVRFGDPETEAVLSLLSESSDFFEICLAACESRLDSVSIDFVDGYAATVIMASGGYPGNYEKNKQIIFNSSVIPGVTIYHAGTSKLENDIVVTNGGRVLAVTGVSKTLEKAIETAYSGVKTVEFDGGFCRDDIGHRALSRINDSDFAKKNSPKLTYSDTGVDIDKGNKLVDLIKPIVKRTKRPGTNSDIGGFGGLFDLKETRFNDPILVSATDGVGTKLIIAQKMGIHTTTGIDLVAMQVNDIIVQGAEPLLFLDYYACGSLEVNNAKDFISGVAEGCLLAGCALIGGETAEMPDIYAKGEYDVAGFAVGAVERENVLPKIDLINAGDVIIGLASSGVHSNGFSLVRKVLSKSGLDLKSDVCPWKISKENEENSIEVLPENFNVTIDASTWNLPPVFKWIKEVGNVESRMVLVVDQTHVKEVISTLEESGETVYNIGSVISRDDNNSEERVIMNNLHTWE